MTTKDNELLSENYNTTISLMDIYLSEWKHREQYMWTQLFKFYYAILIVILFPNLTNFFQVTLPLPSVIFRITGLLLSLIFLYVTIGYVMRFQASSDTYQALINTLPEKYHRKRIDDTKVGRFFSARMTYLIGVLLFLTLFCLSIIMIFI